MTSKRNFLILIPIILFGMFSCKKQPTDTVRIATLFGPSAVSFLHMMEHDTLIDGHKIEIKILKEPQQIQALMVQGELDFAILPTLSAASLYNKGINYRMYACPLWGTMYLLTNDTVTTWQGLRGKKISLMGQGTTPDVLLQKMLDERGIKAQADYTFTTHAEIAQALLMHKTSYAVVSEPMVSNLLHKDASIHIIGKLECNDPANPSNDLFVQTAFLVHDVFAQKNPELTQLIGNAYRKSCDACNADPKATAQLMLKYQLATDLSVAEKSVSLCHIRYAAASEIQKQINQYLYIFFQYNPECVGNTMPVDNFIYRKR